VNNLLESNREQHGESENNLIGHIGGDSDLSPRGRQYAAELGRFIEDQKIPHLRVWTSWMKRTIQTARYIDAPQERWRALNELDAVSLFNHLLIITRNILMISSPVIQTSSTIVILEVNGIDTATRNSVSFNIYCFS
jgi:hypothetical protein